MLRNSLIVLFIFIVSNNALLSIASSYEPEPTGTFSISGYVNNAFNNYKVEGAKVELWADNDMSSWEKIGEYTTGINGYYSISNTMYDIYLSLEVRTSKTGFQIEIKPYDVANTVKSYDPRLDPIDTTTPTISHAGQLFYQVGTTGNTVTWTGADNYPKMYEVLGYAGTIDSGVWESNVPLTINFDGLSLGMHSFSMCLGDYGGNLVYDEVKIYVCDAISFSGIVYNNYDSTPLSDVSVSLFARTLQNNYILWEETTTNVNGEYSVAALLINVYADFHLAIYKENFTLYNEPFAASPVLHDLDVGLIPIDTMAPVVNHIQDITLIDGETRPILEWCATDATPTTYSITRNDENGDWKSWNSGDVFPIALDGYAVGNHTFTIQLRDFAGYETTESVTVTILERLEAKGGCFDKYRDTWLENVHVELYASEVSDLSSIEENDWEKIGETDSLGNGDYSIIFGLGTSYSFVKLTYSCENYRSADSPEYDIQTFSELNNVYFSLEPNDNGDPEIMGLGAIFMNRNEDRVIVWHPVDETPDLFSVTRDGVEIDSGEWDSTTDFTYNLCDLNMGIYNYSITVEDYYNNTMSSSVMVTVVDQFQLSGYTYDSISNASVGDVHVVLQYLNDDGYYVEFPDNQLDSCFTNVESQGDIGYFDKIYVQLEWYMSEFRIIFEHDDFDTKYYHFDLDEILPSVFYLYPNEDIAPIISSPQDITMVEGDPEYLTWDVIEDHPEGYGYITDCVFVHTYNHCSPFYWSSGEITTPLTNLLEGRHNLTIILRDYRGNEAIDSVIVLVNPKPTKPKISDYFDNNIISNDWNTRISTSGIEQTFSEGFFDTGNWGTRNILRMDEGNVGTGRSRYDYYQDLGASFSGDFELSAIIGLYQPYSGEMAFNGLTVLDENWNPIAQGGMYDAWSGSTKKDCASINGQGYSTGYIFNTPNRAIGVKIQRVGDTWSVFLDTDQDNNFQEFTTPILTESCNASARYIGFYFYQYSNYKNPNYFAWTDDFLFIANPISSDDFSDGEINSVWKTNIITSGIEQTFREGNFNTGTWGTQSVLRMDEGSFGTGRSYYGFYQDLGSSQIEDFEMSAIVGMYQPVSGEMAFVRLVVWDENWEVIAEGGLYDAWTGSAKRDCAYLNGQGYSTGYIFMPNRANGVKIQRIGDTWSVFLDTDQDSNFSEFSTPLMTDTFTNSPRYVGFEFFQYSTYKHPDHFAWADDFSFSI